MLVIASGLMLAAMVCVLVVQGQGRGSRGDVYTELEELSASDRAHLKGEIERLNKEMEKKKSEAGKLEIKVEKKEQALKKTVLKAKSERKDGDRLEMEAKKEVKRAANLRARAEKLKNESQEARQKFLAKERPVEKATKLEAHDHRAYRKAEMAVAEDVTALSEHPDNAKMRERVHKLVSAAKGAKSRMEDDEKLLRELQQTAAGGEMNGRSGYAHLREKSVHLARKAESIAEDAVSLAKKGHKERTEANRLVDKAEDGMREPEREHKEAKAEAAKATKAGIKAKELESKLRPEDSETSAAAGGGHEGKFSSDRAELRRDVAEANKEKLKKKAVTSASTESGYDAMERRAEEKEKREAKLDKKWDQGDSASDAQSNAALKAREKREHILSTAHSTFLSGLFGKPGKMPWDTDHDNSLGDH